MSKRILAVKWRQLGDSILWTAALQALKEWDPGASLDLALPTPYLPLFANDDRFDQLWGLDQERKPLPSLKGRLKERKYDIVLNFHAGPRSRALCQGANGALCLIHHHSRSRKRFGSHLPIVGLGQPAAATERDLNVVRTLGWNGKSPPTSLRLPQEWAETARKRWRSAGRSSKPLLLIGASASRPAKQWPLEYFCQLGAMLAPTWDVVLAYESESCFNGRQWQRAELSRHLQLIHTPSLLRQTFPPEK